MKGMRLLTTAIAVYRNISTGTASKTTKLSVNNCKKKKNASSKSRTGIKWTDEQKKIISEVEAGSSVFITGSAGTGKTFLVNHIIEVLRKIHGASHVFITATTGVAACALRGQTLHSFAGVGFAKAGREILLTKVLLDKDSRRRWKVVEALVIDEISMVDADLFDSLEYIARKTRSVNKIWGGIQLVVSGDFLQLPPIISRWKLPCKEFAFEAACWKSSFDSQFELRKIFRQSDFQLIKLLQGIRRGKIYPEGLKLLEQSCSLTETDPSVVQLYPRKEDVEKVNKEQLGKLGETCIMYGAVDSGKPRWKNQLKQGIAPEKLLLCAGARVMLIKNLDTQQQLVNGATGTVLGFTNSGDTDVRDICPIGLLPVVKFDSGLKLVITPEKWYVMEGKSVLATRKQIPLILAWALSIHKCQGMNLDKLHADLSRAFGYGMVYVALSRVRSLDGLQLSGFDPLKIKANPKVLQFYRSLGHVQDNEDEDDGVNKEEDGSHYVVDVSDT